MKHSPLLDPSYGEQGVSRPDKRLFSINASIKSDSGRIAVGQARIADGWGYVVLRVDNAGNLDTGFGDGGLTIGRFKAGFNSAAAGVHIYDQHIIITGSYNDEATLSSMPALARFDLDGKPDISFGDNGNKIIELPENPRPSTALRSTDEVVTSSTLGEGGIFLSYQYPWSHGVIMKLDVNGEYDKRFNGTGYKFLKPPESTESSGRVRLIVDGRIYLTGATNINGISGPYIACLKDTGEEEVTFGKGGYLLTELPSNLMFLDLAKLDNNGNFVCIGSVGTDEGFITAFTSSGEKLSGFKEGTTRFGGYGGQWTEGHVCTLTGKIIAIGTTLGADEADVVVGRFTLDGAPDTEFGDHQGWGRIALGGSIDVAMNSSLEEDGKTLIVGSDFETGSQRQGFLLRCMTDS
ncbi:hypothetical protein DV532_20290 [Pseudomonas sp. Leaf58]|uniref:hypothetical protein n=1 Tax=Pseudomonas sp. Leaf58 TaxID=1736226 RepID=UPI0006FF5A2D|nr:hypothetical protein [Pseudomonas sp. Leaf58]AYG46498.1 hypothetical protein DV532_20290 [Pseudomonas sp. Leaf58]KQN60068.1 hypothetical protein ASF02_16400 [Pseudomonas sp. Leaf58]